MKLREIVEKLDLTPLPYEDVDAEVFSDLNIHIPYEIDLTEHGFKERYYTQWLCTDTHVGASAIFLDGRVVAMTFQPARKSSKSIWFVGKEELDLVRTRILEAVASVDCNRVDFVNLDEEFGEGFQVSYGTQLLTKDVIWRGRPAKVVKTYGHKYEQPVDDWSRVDLDVDGKVHKKIPLEEVTIPFTGVYA